MKAKKVSPVPEFRIQFVTEDGTMVMDRESVNRELWIDRYGRIADQEFFDYYLSVDARVKGVKILRTEVTMDYVRAIVRWLK